MAYKELLAAGVVRDFRFNSKQSYPRILPQPFIQEDLLHDPGEPALR